MESVKINISFGGNIPKIYDDVLGPVYFEPYAIDISDRAAKLKPASILETAAGTGRVTVHLRNKISSASVTATDINPGMLVIAKGKFTDKKISWQEADATSLPFPDHSFDCVVTQFGVMFYPDKVKGFREAFRVLKPGGTFLFSVWGNIEQNPISKTGRDIVQEFFEHDPPAFYNVPYSMYDVNEVLSLLKQAGFAEATDETLTKDCIAESAEVMAAGLVEGNPIVNAIRERDAGAIEALKKKVSEMLILRFGNHPVKATMEAIVFTAKKNNS